MFSFSILMQWPRVTVTISSNYRSEHLLIFLNSVAALLTAGSSPSEFGRSPSSLLLLPAKKNHIRPLGNPCQTILWQVYLDPCCSFSKEELPNFAAMILITPLSRKGVAFCSWFMLHTLTSCPNCLYLSLGLPLSISRRQVLLTLVEIHSIHSSRQVLKRG